MFWYISSHGTVWQPSDDNWDHMDDGNRQMSVPFIGFEFCLKSKWGLRKITIC